MSFAISFFGVPALDWIKARLLPIRKLDRQKPTLLAQLQRAVKNVRRKRKGGCLVHLLVSFDCKVWTKESEGRLRRAFVRLIASSQNPKSSDRAKVFRYTSESGP